MNTQAYITLWHKTLNSVTRMHEWTRRGFEYVNVHVEDKIAFFEKGVESADVVRIRISTDEALDISVGDRVCIGNEIAVTPPNEAYTVMGFADNRRGAGYGWHWKVICK